MAKLKAAMPSWLLPEPVVAVKPATVVAVRESERETTDDEWLSFIRVSPEPRRFLVGRTASGKTFVSIVED